MDTPTAHRLLRHWTLTMVIFGVLIALVPWVRIDMFSWIASGDAGLTDDFSRQARDYLALNQSLIGALIAGLGLAAYWLARVPIPAGERWGWNAFVSSVGVWFVIDCVASVATGYYRNVVFNVLLIVPAIPLLLSTRVESAAQPSERRDTRLVP